MNAKVVGQRLFWCIKAEMHRDTKISSCGVILETYLRYCGPYRMQLGHQTFVMRKLESIHSVTKTTTESLRDELQKTIFPEDFVLPLNPNFHSSGLVIDECMVMHHWPGKISN